MPNVEDFFGQPRWFDWQDQQDIDLEQHLAGLEHVFPLLNVQHVMDILGVPNGSSVKVTIEEDASLSVIAQHSEFGLLMLYSLVFLDDGQWNLALQNIEIAQPKRHQSVATILLLHGFLAARMLGFLEFRCIAIRDDSLGMVGYYVWSLLGFNGLLTDTIEDLVYLEAIKRALGKNGMAFSDIANIQTVQDLHNVQNGKELWQMYGYTLEMVFDLRSNSSSWQIFEAYLKDKGIVPLQDWYL